MFDDREYKGLDKNGPPNDLHARLDFAVNELKCKTPENSAFGVLTLRQRLLFLFLFAAFALAVFVTPQTAFIAAGYVITSYFLIAMAFRIVLMALGARRYSASERADKPVALGSEPADLPVITILAPLYRDAEALDSLSNAIGALDYPACKKDVILLLEEDDPQTYNQAMRLGLGASRRIVRLPDIGPRTKPKACNVGLTYALGDYVVIYDAEDRPEPDQLMKAAAAFREADDKLACVQARLNYYNARENWLTRLFTLEYALWFDWLLPALQRIGAPIPLGGTSNFFRTDILRRAGGWDAYNVTEDADLGVRLSKLGYRIEMLDSTTYEEANCRLGNWVRQRSRWIKGHLLTWLVHMRRPGDIVKTTGWIGLLSLQLFLAGNVFAALFSPVLWILFIAMTLGLAPSLAQAPPTLEALNAFALIFGNACFAGAAMMAPLKRGWKDLCLYGATAPAYWLLTSLAAYKALWQVFFRPYYWEKTDHMISAYSSPSRDAARSPARAA
ncbi:MAG: glycosyltransferase family 2 protein [Pseudomonadota bacterium]